MQFNPEFLAGAFIRTGVMMPKELIEYGEAFENFGTADLTDTSRINEGVLHLVKRIREGSTEIAETNTYYLKKIKKITSAPVLKGYAEKEELTLGIVSGTFDLLHLNHLRVMRDAKAELKQYPRNHLCALVLGDQHIKQKKGANRPVMRMQERLRSLARVKYIDSIIPLHEPNCLKVLQLLAPALFFKSLRDMSQAIVKQEIEMVRSGGGRTCIVNQEGGDLPNTTAIISAVINATID